MYLNLILGAIVAIMCLTLSYLIWHKKKVWLISGDTEQVKDKDKLAKSMGIFLILAGIYLFIFSALIFTIPVRIEVIGMALFGIVTVIFRLAIYVKIK